MAGAELNQDFRDLLHALAERGAAFLLIGGWALALHGHGRGTDDMDIFVKPSSENAARVLDALRDFGAPLATHGITAVLFSTPGGGYQLGIRPNLIEILTTIDGVSFDEAWASRRSFELGGRAIPFIGRQALIRNKRAAGRAKDLADVEWLEQHPEDLADDTRVSDGRRRQTTKRRRRRSPTA